MPTFPKTRYQGSKYKLLPWIRSVFQELSFETALDAFGGSGSVSYLLKEMGKEVHYNDLLRFNYLVGKSLIENSSTFLSEEIVKHLGQRLPHLSYQSTIEKNFSDIYFLDDENTWLDVFVQNLRTIEDDFRRAALSWCLFQSCLAKRPYNLFHRKNLYVRTSEVKRSFGNKTTWDRPFPDHMKNFLEEFNRAVFDNGKKNRAFNEDVFNLPEHYDLVYIDPPYMSRSGNFTDYHGFYHFLEGLVDYENWEKRLDHESKHKRLLVQESVWSDKTKITQSFRELFTKFKSSTLVVSYRSDGLPSVEELKSMLEDLGKNVRVLKQNYQYVLSKNKTSSEVLLVAR